MSTKTMNGFNLFEAMASVDLSKPFNLKPVAEDEEVIGEMSENLMRLNRLRTDLYQEIATIKKEIESMVEEHLKTHRNAPETCAAFYAEAEERVNEVSTKSTQYERINDVFWSALRLELPKVEDAGRAAIRYGGQVVVPTNGFKGFGALSEILDALFNNGE